MRLAQAARWDVIPARLLGTVPVTTSDDAVYAAYETVADAAAAAGNAQLDLVIETGPSEPNVAAIISALLIAIGVSLAIVLTAVGLARTEGRATERVLTSLGADDGIHRRVSAWYALIVVGFSAICGTALAATYTAVSFAGMGYGVGSGLNPVGLPVAQLVLLGVGIPLLAAGVAWLLPVRPMSSNRNALIG